MYPLYRKIRDNSIRVFVSSTFKDMKGERNILVSRVFQRLRQLARERYAELTWVDLRWGITEEQGTSGEVVRLCLNEVNQCIPFFICLLGHRYGWVPRLSEVSRKTLEEQPQVAEWIEKELSVTEMEIRHGILDRPDMIDKAFIYLASREWSRAKITQEMGGLSEEDVFDPDGSQASDRLQQLKNLLSGISGVHVGVFEQLDSLASSVERDFGGFLGNYFPAQDLDRHAAQVLAHVQFAQSRLACYVGGSTFKAELNRLVDAGTPWIWISGAPGMGKTAFLARWICDRQEAGELDGTLYFFSGGTPQSTRWADVLALWIEELLQLHAVGQNLRPRWPGSIADWPAFFEGLCRDVAEKQTLVFVLDAVNQLHDAGWLQWLPASPIPHVCWVVSSLEGEQAKVLREERHAVELRITELETFDRRALVEQVLALEGKRLAEPIVARILEAPESCNPLVLKTLAQEMMMHGSHGDLEPKINQYLGSGNTISFFRRVLERLESDFEKAHDVLSLLGFSRQGLAEAEVLELVGIIPLDWASLREQIWQHLVIRSGLYGFSHDLIRSACVAHYSDQAIHQHRRLAEFFSAQPRKFEFGSGKSQANRRRIIEAGYQWILAREPAHALVELGVEQANDLAFEANLAHYFDEDYISLVQLLSSFSWEQLESTPQIQGLSKDERLFVVQRLAKFFRKGGRLGEAYRLLEGSLALVHDNVRTHGLFWVQIALCYFGDVAGEISQGDRIEKSLECFDHALQLFDQIVDERDRQLQKAIAELGITTSLEQLGTGSERKKNIRMAKKRLLEVLRIFEKLGATHYETDTKNGLASKCIHLGEWEEAIQWAESAMRDWEESGFQQGISLMLAYCLKACHSLLIENPELTPIWAMKETGWLSRLKRMRENCLEGIVGKILDESLALYD